jgi:Zn finger protein HypA/HybF involved in hydrogenase expression
MTDLKLKLKVNIQYSNFKKETREEEWEPSSPSDGLEISKSGSWGMAVDDEGVERSDHAKFYYAGWKLYIKAHEGKVRVNGKKIRGLVPVSPGDVIEIGKAKLTAEIANDPAGTFGNPLYASIEILTKCSECGHPAPINGLVRKVHCNTCQSDFTVGPKTWTMFLEDIQNAVTFEGGMSTNYLSHGTTVEAAPSLPRCAACGASFAREALDACSADSLACPSCKKPMPCGAAPEWAAALNPCLKALFGGEMETQAGAEVDLSGRGDKPVLFKCPGCGGTVKITTQSDRLMTCEFCNADVYIPDDLWLRLHPVKKAEPWWVRFEGKTAGALEYEQKSRNFLEGERSETLSREEAAVEQSREEGRHKVLVWTIIGVLAALTAAVAALYFMM